MGWLEFTMDQDFLWFTLLVVHWVIVQFNVVGYYEGKIDRKREDDENTKIGQTL